MINKKQLREQYRLLKPVMGVYRLVFTIDGTEYYGWTKTLDRIENTLFFRLSVQALQNYSELQKRFNEFHREAFDFSIVETLSYENDEHDYDEELALLLELYMQNNPKAKEIHV